VEVLERAELFEVLAKAFCPFLFSLQSFPSRWAGGLEEKLAGIEKFPLTSFFSDHLK
jgi:hypothetical protein